jgi:hypothetical protein
MDVSELQIRPTLAHLQLMRHCVYHFNLNDASALYSCQLRRLRSSIKCSDEESRRVEKQNHSLGHFIIVLLRAQILLMVVNCRLNFIILSFPVLLKLL